MNTISLSLSDMFSSENNALYNRTDPRHVVDIDRVCGEIKRYDFNLRLSLNLTDFYNGKTIDQVYARARALGADQLTFRILYESGNNSPEDIFVKQHSVEDRFLQDMKAYVQENGRPLERLPFGAVKYTVRCISTVMDFDCMSTAVSDVMKYLILRPDCKLYSRWDDKGSLVF